MKLNFNIFFSWIQCNKISEDHLWFSIFSRPVANNFTRVQRCTCWFVLCFISMFLNIMYYDLSTKAQISNSTVSLSLGPLYISSQQVIWMIFFIIILLKYLDCYWFNGWITFEKSETDIDSKKTRRSPLTFPWWCIFLAYGLSLVLVGISVLFIIARGIEFGDLKTQQWLTSILTGFFSSIFLIQPLKVSVY